MVEQSRLKYNTLSGFAIVINDYVLCIHKGRTIDMTLNEAQPLRWESQQKIMFKDSVNALITV